MIGSFRNFSKSKFAGVLVFIMIIPFVFWGMGGMFSSGNTNNIGAIGKEEPRRRRSGGRGTQSAAPSAPVRLNSRKDSAPFPDTDRPTDRPAGTCPHPPPLPCVVCTV